MRFDAAGWTDAAKGVLSGHDRTRSLFAAVATVREKLLGWLCSVRVIGFYPSSSFVSFFGLYFFGEWVPSKVQSLQLMLTFSGDLGCVVVV